MKKNQTNFINILKKTWWFIWEDDSLLSWLVNIVLAIVLIKFVIYPGLGLLLGTGFPIVAVVSDSMEHDNLLKQHTGFDDWWKLHADFYDTKNITFQEFKQFHFKNGFNKGDLMVLIGNNPQKTKIGDIIVFRGWRSDPIIHRVVEIREVNGKKIFATKGDNNQNQISPSSGCLVCDETNIPEQDVFGKGVIRVPYLGWVKIGAVNLFTAIIR